MTCDLSPLDNCPALFIQPSKPLSHNSLQSLWTALKSWDRPFAFRSFVLTASSTWDAFFFSLPLLYSCWTNSLSFNHQLHQMSLSPRGLSFTLISSFIVCSPMICTSPVQILILHVVAFNVWEQDLVPQSSFYPQFLLYRAWHRAYVQ